MTGIEHKTTEALAHFDVVKPSCFGAGFEYEGGIVRSKEEIKLLREVVRILNDEAVA